MISGETYSENSRPTHILPSYLRKLQKYDGVTVFTIVFMGKRVHCFCSSRTTVFQALSDIYKCLYLSAVGNLKIDTGLDKRMGVQPKNYKLNKG